MEAQELRIGNYVLHEGKVRQVNEIGTKEVNEGICDYVGLDGLKTYSWLEHKGSFLVKPIPITKDWLEKFGFEKTDDYGDQIYYEKDDYYFCFDHDCFAFGRGTVKNIYSCLIYDETFFQHVHQLQNLYFALTREELTIKNN